MKCFFEDAKTVSEELELTLTGKDCGLEERAPMCGIPYHAAEVYIGRLIEKGYKVAICEQMEDPKQAKGIVKREVVRVVTPGTTMNTRVWMRQKTITSCPWSAWTGNSEFRLRISLPESVW